MSFVAKGVGVMCCTNTAPGGGMGRNSEGCWNARCGQGWPCLGTGRVSLYSGVFIFGTEPAQMTARQKMV